jgi:putative hydrolase of the HAD superfamily
MNSTKKPIKAIIFDAGDVLVHKIPDERLESIPEIQEYLSKYELGNKKHFSELYEQVRVVGKLAESNFLLNYSNRSLNEFNIKEICIRLFEDYEIEKWWNNPDSSLLASFQRLCYIGYRIGILTDSALSSNKIRDALDDFSGFISSIVSSRDLGVMKPDPKMYNAILTDLEIPPENALFIAHDLEELEGAQTLHINTINFKEIGDLNLLVNLIEDAYSVVKKV